MQPSLNISERDIEFQVRKTMDEMGASPQSGTQLIFDGECHRYNIDGDKRSSTNGSYRIYTDGYRPAGWIQDWKRGNKLTWKYDVSGFDDEIRAKVRVHECSPEFKARQEQRKQEEDRKRAIAADGARTRFEQAPEAEPDHPYLQRKKVYAYGLKQLGDDLLVPLRDENGVFCSMQRISADTEKHKMFEAGCSTRGAFHTIAADIKDGPVLICEGYATGATLYEVTGYTVVCAMNCHNISAVAPKIKKLYAGRKILVAADNDHNNENNVGIKCAKEAVEKCKLDGYFYPEFPEGHAGSDWNDYSRSAGLERAETLIKEKIEWQCKPKDEREILSRIEVYNAADLVKMEFPPIKWAVEGILPEGCSILFGPPKEGKSFLGLGIALAVAAGGVALGKIPVERGSVCYLALEDTPRRIQSRILCSDLGCGSDLSKLDFVTQIPRQNEGGLYWLDVWLRDHKDARLVIVDTLQKFRKLLPNHGDRYASDYNTVAELKSVFDKYSVSSLLIHHQRKAPDEDWLNTSSGSQGITGSADTIMMLKRGRLEEMGILSITGRDVEETALAMTFDPRNNYWCLEGDAEEFNQTRETKEVIDYLKENGKQSPKELAIAFNVKTNTMQQRLKRMHEKNLVNSDSGKYYI